MKKFKYLLILFLNFLTVAILIFFVCYRFRPRCPKEIFLETNFTNGIIYLILLIVNIFLCRILILEYFEINGANYFKVPYMIISANNWIVNSYDKTLDIIANIKDPISSIIAHITKYYIKIPLVILLLFEYLPKILLFIAFIFDVFYFEKFLLCYKVVYLLLLTLFSKAVLYISIEIDKRLDDECSQSYIIVNYEKVYDEAYNETLKDKSIDYSDYILSDYNTQFSSVEHVLKWHSLLIQELEKLEYIENSLKNPLFFKLFLRLFYTFMFGYIVYYYPISVLSTLFSMIIGLC
jgi:hypothetical protein